MVRWLKPASPIVKTRVQVSARTGLEVCVTQPVSVCVCPKKPKPNKTQRKKQTTKPKPKKQLKGTKPKPETQLKETNKPNQTNEHTKTWVALRGTLRNLPSISEGEQKSDFFKHNSRNIMFSLNVTKIDVRNQCSHPVKLMCTCYVR